MFRIQKPWKKHNAINFRTHNINKSKTWLFYQSHYRTKIKSRIYSRRNRTKIKKKLDLDTSDIWAERACLVGEKKTGKERHIVVQFKSFKHKFYILRYWNKLRGTNHSVFENFSEETVRIRKRKWKEALKYQKDGKISYLQYKTVICKEGRQVS